MDNSKKVERFTLEDGRIAERHISHDASGGKVIEVFAEEKRNLKLEKRITEKRKEILAEQKVETIVDGQIVDVKINSIDGHTKMQLREHIGIADNAELHSLGYVSKKEIGPVVVDAVVAGISALLERQQEMNEVKEVKKTPLLRFSAPEPQKTQVPPALKAQNVVEQNVENKKKSDFIIVAVMAAFIIGQVAFFGYIMLGM